MRAFVAVEISEAIRAELAAFLQELGRLDRTIKWVEPQNLHLTLKFLGELCEANVPEAVEIIKTCAQDMAPFTMEVRDAGAFPNLHRPRVLFAGAVDEQRMTHALARRLNDGMEMLGVEREDRDFQNHITLGRAREPKPASRLAERIEKCRGKSFGTMTVREIVLMQSALKPTGPVYTVVERIELKGMPDSGCQIPDTGKR